MKARVFRIYNHKHERLTDEERFAYEHIRGNAYLPRYPIELTNKHETDEPIDVEYMTIEEFVKNPPDFVNHMTGKDINKILNEIDRIQETYICSECLIYSVFDKCIVFGYTHRF